MNDDENDDENDDVNDDENDDENGDENDDDQYHCNSMMYLTILLQLFQAVNFSFFCAEEIWK